MSLLDLHIYKLTKCKYMYFNESITINIKNLEIRSEFMISDSYLAAFERSSVNG